MLNYYKIIRFKLTSFKRDFEFENFIRRKIFDIFIVKKICIHYQGNNGYRGERKRNLP